MFAADPRFMRRAIALARGGEGHTAPNPMVGAVITDSSGRIIGEGFHRRFGGPHAEVNAVRSVSDPALLKDATIYVTLEPCSHYGKTPPCAKLLIDCGIPRVAIGCGDPNPKVAGRGVRMLREAGIEVIEGMLEDECRSINPAFMTAHTLHRPFITLKWAQTADGYIDVRLNPLIAGALKISTPTGSVLVHRLRSLHEGILVGSGTVLADNPRLDCRLWPAAMDAPRPIVADRRNRIATDYFPATRRSIRLDRNESLSDAMGRLYSEYGMTSVLVEGGATILESFISEGVYDLVRVETSPLRLEHRGGTKAPSTPPFPPFRTFQADGNSVSLYWHNSVTGVNYI
ncbi:MAG: bifunctional diaminohydroxyphosphoribosylaminopyrimidine deaminase/5-amino-6-(5-phosphoribosylamino)uracil reductase RibD [Muribaculaceae bacterium]|nr:bifunctional diaminohydroxyphosphoribosylaminopyrimidine deaminase/5-amino-6-(5-phosphoribosylamino)uracil reductase RibD [Muribaculaceae bacterium]